MLGSCQTTRCLYCTQGVPPAEKQEESGTKWHKLHLDTVTPQGCSILQASQAERKKRSCRLVNFHFLVAAFCIVCLLLGTARTGCIQSSAKDITSRLRMCSTNGRIAKVHGRSALPQYGLRHRSIVWRIELLRSSALNLGCPQPQDAHVSAPSYFHKCFKDLLSFKQYAPSASRKALQP